MNLTISLLYDVFGLDEDEEPIRRLVRAADRDARLAPLILSLAAAEGHPLGSGSADILDRQRRRADTYRRVCEALPATARPLVLKGAAIAACYRPPVMRPVGDLDLLVDAGEVWNAARAVSEQFGATADYLTRLRRGETDHFAIGLAWPSEDPLIESDYEVEIVTFPYAGDLRQVPPALALPESEGRAQLFAVVDERFQRPFNAKDALDCAALLAQHPGCIDGADAEADIAAHRIAPELHELLIATEAALPTTMAQPTEQWLAHAAVEERARRTASPPIGEGWGHPHPDVRYGLKVATGDQRHHGCVSVDTSGGELLSTPVGDFLMVQGASVSARDVQAAREASQRRRSQPEEDAS